MDNFLSEMDLVKFHKMAFIYNALEDGWAIKKKENLFIFTKQHQNQKEVYLDDYLKQFINKNINIGNIQNS
tara:strand:+ start:288 stop:500 length:213 start_codon:yes stop_codon:yes gene_type:complete